MAEPSDSGDYPTLRWQVTWRYGRPDVIAWMALLTGAIFVVACVVIEWGFGAALGGLFLGCVATLFGFTTQHFQMESDHEGYEDGQEAALSARGTTVAGHTVSCVSNVRGYEHACTCEPCEHCGGTLWAQFARLRRAEYERDDAIRAAHRADTRLAELKAARGI